VRRIDVESLQDFLMDAAPSFRDDCLRGRLILGDVDNFYHLLMDFQRHLERLHAEDSQSEAFANVLKVVNELLERGTDSIRDATTIQIIDVIIKNEALRAAAAGSELAALSSAIDLQISNWDAFRRRLKAELADERGSSS
jgi:hypothetical protein